MRQSRMVDGQYLAGFIIIILGVIFLLGNVYPDFHFWRLVGRLWPVILIVIGIYLLIENRDHHDNWRFPNSSKQSHIIGDLHLDYSGRDLGDIKVSQTVGDLTINLSGSRLKPGINHLDTSTVIGDTLMVVPLAFPFKISAQNVVGKIKFDPQRREADSQANGGIFPKLEYADDGYEGAQDKLLITVSGVIGDIRIQRV